MTFNDYANSLLMYFVSNYENIYGEDYLSYNVHNLIHLANNVHRFGSLDNFSCFKYENYMQKIKNKLHRSGKPLEELANRVFEELQLSIQPCHMKKYLVNYTKKNEISHIQFKTKIAINEFDNCALLYDMSVIFIMKIFEENGIVFIHAQRFLNLKSLFTTPCPSEKLGIFVIPNITSFDVIKISVTQIQRKCVKLKFLESNSYVTIPLLHVNN